MKKIIFVIFLFMLQLNLLHIPSLKSDVFCPDNVVFFNGTNAYGVVKGLFQSGYNYTVSFLVKVNQFDKTYLAILGQNNYPRIQFYSGGAIVVNVLVDGVDREFWSNNIGNKVYDWLYVTVIIYNQNYIDFYINGQFLNRATNIGNITFTDPNTNNITIGSTTLPIVNDFNGYIVQILIYNRALNANEIQNNYNNFNQPTTVGLILWLHWDLISNDGTIWYDKSLNNNNALLFNTLKLTYCMVRTITTTATLTAINVSYPTLVLDSSLFISLAWALLLLIFLWKRNFWIRTFSGIGVLFLTLTLQSTNQFVLDIRYILLVVLLPIVIYGIIDARKFTD